MTEIVAHPPVRRWRRRLLAGSVLAGFLVCVSFVVWFYILGPKPPQIALPDDDPGAAQDIAEALADVKYWPFRSLKWGRLGMILGSYGYQREAIVCFARASQLSPSSMRWPYLQSGYEMKFDPDAGLALLERSVQLKPSAHIPRLALGETLFRLGRTDEAAEHFQFVLQNNPDDPRALFGMGCVANNRGELPASRDYLMRSARLAPRFRGSHTLLAEVSRRLGDEKQADRERTLAVSLSPDAHWPDPYAKLPGQSLRGEKIMIDRANALLKENRAEESLQLLKEMPEGGDQWYRRHLQLGRAYAKLGDHVAAEKAFRDALRLKSDSFEAFVGLGIALESQDNFAAAAEQCRKALALKPDADSIHYRLGRCLESEGDLAGAIEAMQNALRYKPDGLPVHHDLAHLLIEDGRAAEAREVLKRALEFAPDDRKSRVMLERLVESPKTDAPQTEQDEATGIE